MSRVHPALKDLAGQACRMTREFAGAMAAAVKEHGRDLPQRGYVQERVADAAIDLYALLAVLSRATASLERDDEAGGAGEGAGDEKQGGAARDITLARLFARQAGHRFDLNMELLRGADDDLLTAASLVAYSDRGYHLA